MELSSRQKGELAELLAIAELAQRGFQIAIPYGNTKDFDLLIRADASCPWRTIQVKTARHRPTRSKKKDNRARRPIFVDTIRGSSLSKKRGYENGAFDFLMAVEIETRFIWVIEFHEMRGRRCLTFDTARENGFENLL